MVDNITTTSSMPKFLSDLLIKKYRCDLLHKKYPVMIDIRIYHVCKEFDYDNDPPKNQEASESSP
jgi:hypothetical protein